MRLKIMADRKAVDDFWVKFAAAIVLTLFLILMVRKIMQIR